MMDKDREVYLVHYKRTAFSRSRPNAPEKDVFNSIRMDEALGQLIKNSVSETGVKAEEINDVITGCAIQADENWLYGGRHPVFMAGLPFNVPSMSLDRACSSSLNAMSIGAMEIMTGNSDIVLAGGMEHMTHVPLSNNPHVKPNIKLIVRPEYARYDMTTSYNMGLTAEKLPPPGSVTARPIIFSPFCTAPRYFVFWLSLPKSMITSAPKRLTVAAIPIPGSALHSSSMVTSIDHGFV